MQKARGCSNTNTCIRTGENLKVALEPALGRIIWKDDVAEAVGQHARNGRLVAGQPAGSPAVAFRHVDDRLLGLHLHLQARMLAG